MSDHQQVTTSIGEPQQSSENGTEMAAEPNASVGYLRGVVASGADEQARALTHPNLDRVQRQLMAASIAQRRGNSHMRTVVNSIQRAFPQPQTAANATSQSTLDKIKKELDTWWVGPLGEGELERLWGTYGTGLPDVLEGDEAWGLFLKSYDVGAEVDELGVTEAAKKEFTEDVRKIGLSYLSSNEAKARAELESIGAPEQMSMAFGEDHKKKLAELQEAAKMVEAMQKLQSELQTIPVGYTEWETYDTPGGGMRSEPPSPANFNPNGKPPRPPKEGDNWPSWEMVNNVYQQAEGAISQFAEHNPAIFPLIGDKAALAKFTAADNPEEAKAVLSSALNGVLTAIRKSQSALQGSDLDPRELKPIHRQLQSGAVKGPSGKDWSRKFNKWASEKAVGDFESTEFWISIGLGTVAAVAFIVAEVATFGSATFIVAAGVGALATGATVGRSWDQYFTLATAKDSSLSKDTQLVDQGQVDMALLSAILDTGFALLDVYGLAKSGAKSALVAGLKAGSKALTEVGQLAAKEAEPLLIKAITEFGTEEAVKKTGMSVESLIAKFGEGSEVGKMLKAGFKADALIEVGQLSKVIAEQGVKAADDIAVAAIRQHGAKRVIEAAGGWKAFTKALGDNAQASKMVFDWRNSVFAELKQFAETVLKKSEKEAVVPTGTSKPTSDLDMSFLGLFSSKNRMEAMEFLKGRLGVSGKDDLLHLLDMDLFTDPVRLTLYKNLPPEVASHISKQAAARERELIFAERLYHARQMAGKEGAEGSAGKQLVEQIEGQMKQLGIPEAAYKPLTQEQVGKAAAAVDELHQSLSKTTDLAEQMKLADQIAQHQALINAAEQGGYLSGGGVERFVQDRALLEKLKEATQQAGKVVKYPMDDPAVFAAAIDQMLKMDHYAVELKAIAAKLGGKGKVKPEAIFDAVKAVSKYGERLGDLSASLLGGGGSTAAFKAAYPELEAATKVLSDLLAATGKDAADPLIQQIARDGVGVVERALAGLGKMDGAMDSLLATMQRKAGLENVAGALEAMQKMVSAQAAQIAMTNALRDSLQVFVRDLRHLLDIAQKGVTAAADTPADPDAPKGVTVAEVLNMTPDPSRK